MGKSVTSQFKVTKDWKSFQPDLGDNISLKHEGKSIILKVSYFNTHLQMSEGYERNLRFEASPYKIFAEDCQNYQFKLSFMSMEDDSVIEIEQWRPGIIE